MPVGLRNPAALNILTLVGEHDPVTSLENLEGMFPRYLSKTFMVKENAHITISNPCVTEVTIKFIASGIVDPSDCMELIK